MDVVHEVKKQHSQFHYEVSVVDICAFALPGPWMIQIPQMDGVTERYEICQQDFGLEEIYLNGCTMQNNLLSF